MPALLCRHPDPAPHIRGFREVEIWKERSLLNSTAPMRNCSSRSLQCRKERLCDIRQELCDQDPADELEREELVYFEQQEAAVQRIITELRVTLKMAPTG